MITLACYTDTDSDVDFGMRWLASIPASPPAEPDAPEAPGKAPDKPVNPDLPPEEDVPPEIDDPPPDVIPEPIREPPIMPPPTAVTEIRADPYWRHRPMADRDPLGIASQSHDAGGRAMHAASRPYANDEHGQAHAGLVLQLIRRRLTAFLGSRS